MDFKLGKQEYSYSEKTVKMARFMAADISYAPRYDFDHGRVPFPLGPLGNDQYGCCVKSAEANQVMRFERAEQRATLQISAEDVIREYKLESQREFGHAPVSPDDEFDQGLIMRVNLTNWRKSGFTFKNRTYNISAFGELDPLSESQVRAAIYHFGGVQLGFQLPFAARQMTNMGTWDYKGETGPEWKPGSWGGHCVFSKAYDPFGLEVLTWGRRVKVTDSFIARYCDEAWTEIDNLDSWRTSTHVINIAALQAYLHEIGASNIEV